MLRILIGTLDVKAIWTCPLTTHSTFPGTREESLASFRSTTANEFGAFLCCGLAICATCTNPLNPRIEYTTGLLNLAYFTLVLGCSLTDTGYKDSVFALQDAGIALPFREFLELGEVALLAIQENGLPVFMIDCVQEFARTERGENTARPSATTMRAVRVFNGIQKVLFNAFGTGTLVAVIALHLFANGLCVGLHANWTGGCLHGDDDI